VSYVQILPPADPGPPAALEALAVADDAAQTAELARRVRQEVERLRAKAEQEGRAAGMAAGLAAARIEAAAALGPATAALREAWAQLAAPLAQQQLEIATLVTELAFSLARHIVGATLQANPDGLTTLVERLIKEAAAERSPRQTLLVRVNPADYDLLAAVLALDQAQLLADEAITQGGAMVEIVAPDGDPVDKIEWDATIETRLAAVQEALGMAPEGVAR
jgi:flagellar assembly protein FliH